MTRTDPPTSGTEAEVLLGYVDFHRETLRTKVAGLTPEQLAQTLAPSTMTLGGMVHHLAFVEDWWFSQVFLGRPPSLPWSEVDWSLDEDWDWHSVGGRTVEDLIGVLDGAIAASNAIVSDALASPDGLDTLGVRRSQHNPDQQFSLRWILVHMVEEYARHNGHADLLRESIDGTVGE